MLGATLAGQEIGEATESNRLKRSPGSSGYALLVRQEKAVSFCERG
jgi:hypothetical protein